jgi:hypothetical protein
MLITAAARPVWTNLLTELKNMMRDLEGRQRLIIEYQESFKQRDKQADEILKALQKRQEELTVEIGRIYETRNVCERLHVETLTKITEAESALKKLLVPKQ